MEKVTIPDCTHTFLVPARDGKGRIVRDENENPLNDEYIYDFELMGVDRMLTGRKLFFLANKEFDNSPKIVDELSALVTREAERQAFASILMKKEPFGFEKYDSYKVSSFDALSDIKGTENFNKLMECRDHFFLKVGLSSPQLMTQSLDIMSGLMNVVKSMNDIKDITGAETMAQIRELLKDSPLPTQNEENSTI